MKNVIATTAALATLFAGSAAFAGGYASDYAFVGAGVDGFKIEAKADESNRAVKTQEIDEFGRTVIAPVTVYDTNTATTGTTFQGR